MRCRVVAYEATPPTITGTGHSAMNSLRLSGVTLVRHVLGRDDGALDDEHVEPGLEGDLVVLLDALRRERRGGHHAAVLDLFDAPGDELLFDGLLVDLLHGAGRRLLGQRGDAVELLVGVLVAGLYALEVEHGEAAELAHGDGEGRVDHAVHGRGKAGERQGERAELPGDVDVFGVARAPARGRSRSRRSRMPGGPSSPARSLLPCPPPTRVGVRPQ